MKYIVQMKGDDVVDVILSIKGAVQSYVRYGKFKSASFKANKREGTIAAEGVDKRTLEAALNKAMSNIPGKKLMYEIEEVPPEAPPGKPPEGPDAEEAFQRWVEQAQRKWDQKKHAYDREIEKLHEQMRKLREEKLSLVKLRKEDERIHSDLQKSSTPSGVRTSRRNRSSGPISSSTDSSTLSLPSPLIWNPVFLMMRGESVPS